MIIRRLHPDNDEGLLRESFTWDTDAPSWYLASDAICRPTLEAYLNMTRDENQVDIGVFDDEGIQGLITFDYKGNGIVEVRLSAKRGASADLLTNAAYQVRHQIYVLGMRAGVVWVAKRNRHVIRLCETIGFVRDGLTMTRGTYYRKVERPIEWVRLITTREQWLAEQRVAA